MLKSGGKDEHTIQAQFVARVRNFFPNVVIAAIPNGGSREYREAVNLKAEGVLPGMPDLIIAIARGGYFGLFVEMKSESGTISPDQNDVMRRLSEEGYLCEVCWSVEDAVGVLESYLSWRPTLRGANDRGGAGSGKRPKWLS